MKMKNKSRAASAEEIYKDRLRLQNQYAHLNDEDGNCAALATASTQANNSNPIDLSTIRDPSSLSRPHSTRDIGHIVRTLQIEMWRKRELLLDTNQSIEPLDLFDPIIALKAIGYKVDSTSGLGQHDNGHGKAEVAGYIDSSKKVAGISNQLSADIKNFTAAHELGHAVLHNAVGMHRDRAIDGGIVSGPRAREELEADKFASLFLMPESIIRQEFLRRFKTEQFTIDDNSAYLLANYSMDILKAKVKNSRQLGRMLAESLRYDFAFTSMKSRFNVSTEAMAIRLEELNLVEL